MTPRDLEMLRHAKSLLEAPGIAAILSDLVSTPIEKGFKMISPQLTGIVNRATQKAMVKAFGFVISTFDTNHRQVSSDRFHKLLVLSIGACGGALGLPALIIELPITTTIMIRSIVDIARSEDADLEDPQTHLECIQVFAFGNVSQNNLAPDAGYFAVRTALARSLTRATQHVTERGLLKQSTPAIIRFLSQISSRFGALVSEKLAAQAVPLIGAAGGAWINTLFINHFQKMARGHFIIRRLEHRYGEDEVRAQYYGISNGRAAAVWIERGSKVVADLPVKSGNMR